MDDKAKKINVEIGQRISQLRKHRNLSQEELAKNTGINQNVLGFYERGERNIPTINIKLISDALTVPTDLLINGIPEIAKNSYSLEFFADGGENTEEYHHFLQAESDIEFQQSVSDVSYSIAEYVAYLRDTMNTDSLEELNNYINNLRIAHKNKHDISELNNELIDNDRLSRKAIRDVFNKDDFKEWKTTRENITDKNIALHFMYPELQKLNSIIENIKESEPELSNELVDLLDGLYRREQKHLF